MIDYGILADYGTTDQRLREFFTAEEPSPERRSDFSDADLERINRDVEMRRKLEDRINSWLQEHIQLSLQSHHHYSAVDIAWDSSPITKYTIPLMLYAQGRIKVTQAIDSLKKLPGEGKEYIKRENGGVMIDLPKFLEVNINLIRSVVTRRCAAQVNKYASLKPHFKYEVMSNDQKDALLGDLTSQRMDIMANQFGYKHFDGQCIRDMMLYAHTVAFPTSAWEKEYQLAAPDLAGELIPDSRRATKKRKAVAKIVKEGVNWVKPHPSRVFYDNAYPLSSLNTDTGCEYCGYWDVKRYGDIRNDPNYFRRKIGMTLNSFDWFDQYANYFNQYFNSIRIPEISRDLAIENDRSIKVGVYSGNQDDAGVLVSHVFAKLTPADWLFGEYPYPVWFHFTVAGDRTVIGAEIMPSGVAAVGSYNEHDGRMVNLSIAHELMGFQDQLTNLFRQLLEVTKQDLFSVAILNSDVFPDTEEGRKVREDFEDIMTGRNWFDNRSALAVSFEKLRDLGVNLSADNIFKVVRSGPNTEITKIFDAIVTVVSMSERLQVMSSQEQGQAAPREITATETSMIAGATSAVYSYISNAVDEMRSAMKRICYESLIAFGSDEIYLPVLKRYSKDIIIRAGFEPIETGQNYFNVRGSKQKLVYDYVFTGRDGADRSSNRESAKVLIDLIGRLATLSEPVQIAVWGALGKTKLFEILNTIFRLADAPYDLNLEVLPGEDDSLLPGQNSKIIEAIQQLTQIVSNNSKAIEQFHGAQLKGGNGTPLPNEAPPMGIPPQRQAQPQPGFGAFASPEEQPPTGIDELLR